MQQCPDTAEHLLDCESLAAQVLVIGKISQAAVVAASAYKDQEAFQKQTGITKSCLIDDKLHRNTKVLHWSCLYCCRWDETAQQCVLADDVHTATCMW